MAIPACLWRRTGEIYKANREFAELVGVDGFMLRDVSAMYCLLSDLLLTFVAGRADCAFTS